MLSLDDYLALPPEDKFRVQQEMAVGRIPVKDFPGIREFGEYRRNKKSLDTLNRLQRGICPFCGRVSATMIRPRPLGLGIGQRKDFKIYEGGYWQCEDCSGKALAKIYTGGTKHEKEISKRRTMQDGSIGYFEGENRVG